MPPSTLREPSAHTHALLARAEAEVEESRRLDARRAQTVLDWVEAHRVDGADLAALSLGAAQVLVEPFCDTELAVALRVHPLAARSLMSDVVDLSRRMPRTWAALQAGELELWVARKLAVTTRELDAAGVAQVDTSLADVLRTLPTGRLLDLAAARAVEADPAAAEARAAERRTRRGAWLTRPETTGEPGLRTLVARGPAEAVRQTWATLDHLAHLLQAHAAPGGDPVHDAAPPTLEQLRGDALHLLANPLAALKLLVGADEHDLPEVVARAIQDASPTTTRPRAVTYVHLSPSLLDAQRPGGPGSRVARAEELGALTRDQLVELLGHHHVTLRPVIDLAEDVAADCYEVPVAIAERVHLLRPADSFPHGSDRSRATDLDHAEPYRPHGPPGQTRVGNLAHLGRAAHRTKTHHPGWRLRLDGGRSVWTTPHGYVLVTDGRGTHRLGRVRSTPSTLERRVLDLAWHRAVA